MSKHLFLLPSFLFVFGCEEVELSRRNPPEQQAVQQLRAGGYTLRVEGVRQLDCDDADPRDLEGLELELMARFSGADATLILSDLRLEGRMEGGSIRAIGSPSDSGTVDYEVDTAEDRADETDTEVDHEDAPDHGEEEGYEGRPEEDEEAEPDEPDHDDPPAPGKPPGSVELRLGILDARHAEGLMVMRYPGDCSASLEVSLRPGSGAVPVEENEPPCGDEEDCG